jgi:DNA-directed RNA polymerase, beta subunit
MSYKNVNYGKKSVRRNYSKVRTDVALPNLIEIQTKSFDWFVTEGLKELFRDVSPIKSYDGNNLEIYFGDFRFEDPKFDVVDCKLRDINYSRPLKVKVRLNNNVTGEQKEKELFMGDVPYMTPVGTFIINGAERVVISQIVRSAGVYYANEIDKKSGQVKYTGQVIPTRGAWIEYETGSRDVWYGKLDRSKKIPITTLLRAFGLSSNEQITALYGESPYMTATFEKDTSTNSEDAAVEVYAKLRQGEKVPVDGARSFIASRLFEDRRYDLQKVGRYKYNLKLDVLDRAKGNVLNNDIVANDDIFDDATGEFAFAKGDVIAPKGAVIEGEVLENLKKGRQAFRQTVDLGGVLGQENPQCEILECLVTIGDTTKLVKMIGNDQREESLHITLSDILAATSYYFNLYDGVGSLDDIDHLGNRRLRLIGELLKNQFRIGFAHLEKNIVERMSTVDIHEATPENLINVKPLSSALKEFFGSSQLSQFMDQINPLAEITQKRRVSALGTGGIARDRAGVEVRDVHNSHYGRMCPIETPEGPSCGLITSLATYARVNDFGFIETPYLVAKIDENGKKYISEDIEYLSADRENGVVIASASTKLDSEGHIIEEKVIGRRDGETEIVSPDTVDYMDVSPKQVVSVAASCIPFLEHDDATRALMGANMQRQAVPIIAPESPIVGTGMEYFAAKDSGSACVATMGGIVEYVDAKKIVVREDDGNLHTYKMYQFLRSNSSTTIWQRPIVKPGERIDRGDVIADGQSMQNGELALGRNVRVGFMTWEGYNYEDAVIMNEQLVINDVYTSVHIEEYTIESRDTKLGKEEITRDIPGVGEEMTKYLDENGIIIPGTEVKEGDILVGKITPKGQTDPTPEERLLLAIFGDKSRDSRDTSLKVPHGGSGVVQSVQHFSKKNGDDLNPGVNDVVRVYIIQKRKIGVGDKMSGRHGNKGVISNVLPQEDMPYSADGKPLDIVLNPQGVPSRMNIGQVLELHLGLAAKKLGVKIATPVFDGLSYEDLMDIMKEADVPTDGKITLYDGRTGEPFENKVNVGIMYFIKLDHMVDDKLHARSVGPYTLVTQQPMGGKAQNGGQRFGEMEVWALEAYGAAHTLQEMLTVKSDDLVGRNNVFHAIVDGRPIPDASIPESFRVLGRELQALGIHVELISEDGTNEINKSIVDENDDDYISKFGM